MSYSEIQLTDHISNHQFYLLKFLLSFHELYLQVAPLLVSLLLLLLSFDNLFPLSLL